MFCVYKYSDIVYYMVYFALFCLESPYLRVAMYSEALCRLKLYEILKGRTMFEAHRGFQCTENSAKGSFSLK